LIRDEDHEVIHISDSSNDEDVLGDFSDGAGD
jgi:hypothetical protein